MNPHPQPRKPRPIKEHIHRWVLLHITRCPSTLTDLSCLQCPHPQGLMISTQCQSWNYASSLVHHHSKYTKHFMRFMNHTQEPVALKFLLDHSLSNPLLLKLGIHPASQLTSPSGGCQPTLHFVYLLTISGIYNAEQFICPKLYFNLCSITRQSF